MHHLARYSVAEQHHHGDHAVTEQDQDERAEKLSNQLGKHPDSRSKAKGKRQKREGKRKVGFAVFHFCLLPFAFCLLLRPSPSLQVFGTWFSDLPASRASLRWWS